LIVLLLLAASMSLPDNFGFNLTAVSITTQCASILNQYDSWYTNFIGKEFSTKIDFFQHFEQTADWDLKLECMDFMQYVHPEQSVREASVETSKKVSEFGNKWAMDVGVYNTILNFHTIFESELEGEEQLYLQRTMDGYKHNGIHLDTDTRNKLAAISQKLDEMSINYGNNLNEVTDHIFFTKEELDGVASDFIDTLEEKDGEYKITTQYDHINMIMPYCNVENTRKTLSKLFGLRGKEPFGNQNILKETLALRKEKAKLLGYSSYRDYVLSHRRMASNAEQVDDFVTQLLDKMKSASKSDKDIIAKHFNKDDMESWNLSYYTNLYKKEVLQYDQKLVQEYFPLETLLPNLLGTFEDIFSLHIKEVSVNPDQSWHDSVKCYAVYDNTSDNVCNLIGHFYVDLYPRDGKYGHAAAFTLKPAYIPTTNSGDSTRSTPVSAMVCNFTRPTKEKPSLLTFGEVETFFHELGHIFHQLLSINRFAMFSGTSVELDFVECPSQALENWCYEEEFLTRISSHYKTGETIPVELMQKIKKNKHMFNGLHYIRQLMFTIYDMKLHSSDNTMDAEQLFDQIQSELSPLIHGESCMAANFGHLMGGYESGYYGYLWSEVYAAEVFQYFKDSGDIFNREIGLHYRQCILEKGGTETGFRMMKNLLGREPNNAAFMKAFE
jgi:Zn-dependent oligopeptidase